MPTGTVANQQAMGARGNLRADFGQVLVHRLGIDCWHDDRGTDATAGADCAKYVKGIMTVIAHHDGREPIGAQTYSIDPFCPTLASSENHISIALPDAETGKISLLKLQKFF